MSPLVGMLGVTLSLLGWVTMLMSVVGRGRSRTDPPGAAQSEGNTHPVRRFLIGAVMAALGMLLLTQVLHLGYRPEALGRLAQRESTSLTRKGSGVQIPQRPPTTRSLRECF